jgi:hypothetical protein
MIMSEELSKLEKRVMLGVGILCLIVGLAVIVQGVDALTFGGLSSWVLFVFLVPTGALVVVVGFLVLRKLRREILRNK